MATATKTKTWAAGETLNFDDANANFDTLFTFFGSGGSVAHNDGSQSFSADVDFPYRFATVDTQAVRKRQVDMSPELVGVTPTCWLHSGAHATPALGIPYMMWGDSVVATIGFAQYNIPLPEAFPTDILTVLLFHGEGASASPTLHLHATVTGSTTSNIRVGASAPATTRFQWLVVGW